MDPQKRTVFFEQHLKSDAQMVEFGGWEMPIQYSNGIREEHLATRCHCGLFDVSHMGRIYFYGPGTVAFLQYILSNNANDLKVGESQYTIIQNREGGALDDAYLYLFKEGEYLLVVNASNKEKDLEHLKKHITAFDNVEMIDKSDTIAMLSLQGPEAEDILDELITDGNLPVQKRNCLSRVKITNTAVDIARTGYTGEPICFELFLENNNAIAIWEILLEKGAMPIGLGARDTLRLEAGLPLYGHELGIDHEGKEIPIFALPFSRFAVSFSEEKGEFLGKAALSRQVSARDSQIKGINSPDNVLPKTIKAITLTGKGIAREGYKVFQKGQHVGYITSGTSVPYRRICSETNTKEQGKEKVLKRSIAMALLRSDIIIGEKLEIEIRKKTCEAVVVQGHINSRTPPYTKIIE